MKKLFYLIILILFFVNFTTALDCQYTEFKQNEKQRTEYYLNGDLADIKPPFVNVTDIWDGKLTLGTTRNYKITLKNYVAEQLNVTLRYNAEGKQREHILTIDPLASTFIEGSYSQDLPFFDSASIRIDIDNIEQKEVSYLESIEVCKLCGNEICLNEGASCNPLYDNSKCGSGICNIAGFCGNQKIVDCPNGKLNCQDKICLDPSTKEVGEGYTCSFECKSDRFENGTCLKSFSVLQKENDERNNKLILFGVVVLIVFSILVGKFAILPYIKKRKEEEDKIKEAEKQRKEEEARRDNAKDEYAEIIKRKEEVKKEIEENSQILEDLKREREEIERSLMSEKEKSKKKIDEIKRKEEEEIKKWEDKKKNKSIEAQKVIDKEIENLRLEKNKEIMQIEEDYRKKKSVLNSKIEENKTLYIEEERKGKEREETIKKIEESKKLMNEFHLNKQGYRVRLNEKGYEVLEDGTSFHVFWYCKNSNEKQKDLKDQNFEIHHIDGDKWNNDYSNLIKIDNLTHTDIHRYNVRWIGYRKGVEILSKYSSIKLPERVVQEIKRLEKRKNIITKKVFRRH